MKQELNQKRLFEISKNWIHPESNDNIGKLISKINFANLRSIKVA